MVSPYDNGVQEKHTCLPQSFYVSIIMKFGSESCHFDERIVGKNGTHFVSDIPYNFHWLRKQCGHLGAFVPRPEIDAYENKHHRHGDEKISCRFLVKPLLYVLFVRFVGHVRFLFLVLPRQTTEFQERYATIIRSAQLFLDFLKNRRKT
jgi:hypothetical protein